MDNCIFCKIINREIPSDIVYEDENIIAFNDINPVADTHILVVPKKHFDDVMEMKDKDIEYVSKVFETIQKIAKEKGIDDKGFRVINNCGEGAGQTVKHVHFHLIAGDKITYMC